MAKTTTKFKIERKYDAMYMTIASDDKSGDFSARIGNNIEDVKKLQKAIDAFLKKEDKQVVIERTCEHCKFFKSCPRCMTGVVCKDWDMRKIYKKR